MESRPRTARDAFRPDLVPRWATIVAWVIPLLTLPSLIWRLQMAIGSLISDDNPCINSSITPVFEWVYVTAILPTVQLGLALLSLGLVQRWGVGFPRWLPLLGRRRVPIGLGVTAAVTGALGIVAVVVWTQIIRGGQPRDPAPPGCTLPGDDIHAFYLPMLLWPPLLLLLAWHYLRRRRAERS